MNANNPELCVYCSEYALNGQFSDEVDVNSYGVALLELVSLQGASLHAS